MNVDPVMYGNRSAISTDAGAMLGATAAVLPALAFVWMLQLGASAAAPPPGVEHFSIPERTSVDVPVRIDRSPPVAGNHAPVW